VADTQRGEVVGLRGNVSEPELATQLDAIRRASLPHPGGEVGWFTAVTIALTLSSGQRRNYAGDLVVSRFAVWAPHATRVEVQTRGRRWAMGRMRGGWYALDDPMAQGGDDYWFVLDGGRPLPDPRSAWQPHGVHGASRLLDHRDFAWRDGGWLGRALHDTVVYELHCGTFSDGGTFDGAIEHLGHLVDLGVGAVEVMPVAAFPGVRGWGYDGVDVYAVHEAYGGPGGLKRFVDACHRAGLAVIMDVVYNHLGPDGNVLGEYGPYFTDRHRTPWGDAVNYDGAGSDEVRRFAVDNALMWLRDYHVDGLRLDAVHAIVDTSAVHILEEIASAAHGLAQEIGRPLWVIAESDLNDPRLVSPPRLGGYGSDAQWSDDFHHALHATLSGERAGYYADFGAVADVAAALRQVFVSPGRYSAFRGRRHGRDVGDLPATRFLGYLQNHDQVGNRARGERTGALMSVGRLQIAAALVLLGPFVPMLFMGEEWAASTPFLYFTDHEDAALGRAVSEGRRREFATFGWSPEEVPDPQDPTTFQRSRLDWAEPTSDPHAAVLRWHRDLIALRAANSGLRDGDRAAMVVEHDEASRTLVVRRAGVTVACNWGDAPVVVAISVGDVPKLLSAGASIGEGSVQLEPDSVAVLAAGEFVRARDGLTP
jgi:maltooligosyltrehalose trehalohydrolase